MSWLRYANALIDAKQPHNAISILAQARAHGLQGPLVDEVEAKAQQQQQPTAAEPGAIETLLARQDWQAAAQEAARQLAQAPDDATRRHWLAQSLYHQGRYAEALPHYERVAVQRPEDGNVLNQLGLTLKQLKAHERAHAMYQRALGIVPDAIAVYVNIGANLNSARQHRSAIEWLDQGLKLAPEDHRLHLNKAVSLLELDKLDDAAQQIQWLRTHAPESADLQVVLGRYQQKTGCAQEALEAYTIAEQLGANHGGLYHFRADALSDLGQFDDAEYHYRKALEVNPNAFEAWASLAHLRKMTGDDRAWCDQAQRYLQDDGITLEQSIELHYALGKFYNDTQDYPSAFRHYQRANQQKQQRWHDEPYDRQQHHDVVNTAIKYFRAELFEQWRKDANTSVRPVFIVGMPRSGTSLTEQILASHPEIAGAGELRFWPELVQNHESRLLNRKIDADWLRKTAQQCLENLKDKSADAARVVDKMPGNFLWVGLIHTVFPNARILHSMRNPVDNALSIFFQNLKKGHAYANELDDIAHYYRQYHRLMQHWRAVIPPERFLELPYEQLVDDQEGWSRRIMDFIGLDWDARMLSFYKTERRVGTASNWQARQPIYKTSKERWRHYEKFVKPLLPLLELYDPAVGQLAPAQQTGQRYPSKPDSAPLSVGS